MKNEINWENNVIVSSMELARVFLSEDINWEVRNHVLDILDISDDEADILLQRIEEYMNVGLAKSVAEARSRIEEYMNEDTK